MKTTVNQRFQQMIAALGITRNAFARQIGVSSAQIYNIIGGRNAPSFDVLSKIAITFPTVNMIWLLTGQGPVLLPQGHEEGLDMLGKLKVLEEKIAAIEGGRKNGQMKPEKRKKARA